MAPTLGCFSRQTGEERYPDGGSRRLLSDNSRKSSEKSMGRRLAGHHDRNRRREGAMFGNESEDEGEPNIFAADDLDTMTTEERALVIADQQEIDEALTVMQNARRTVKDARARQHAVKISRRYYRPGAPRQGQQRSERPGFTANYGQCIKCAGQHRTSDCPDKNDRRLQAHMSDTPEPTVTFADSIFMIEDAEPEVLQWEPEAWCGVSDEPETKGDT